MCVIEWQDYTGYAFIEIESDEVVEICDGFFFAVKGPLCAACEA